MSRAYRIETLIVGNRMRVADDRDRVSQPDPLVAKIVLAVAPAGVIGSVVRPGVIDVYGRVA